MLSAAMNGFYGLKRLSGNLPADAPLDGSIIKHPLASDIPHKLYTDRIGASGKALLIPEEL